LRSLATGENTRPSPAIPIVSLFSGAGGLDLGFTDAGFEPVLAIDIDPAACQTFKLNHSTSHVIRYDLSNVPKGYIPARLSELPKDVRPIGVIGGPPCQAFSLSNVYKKTDDPRARLPASYARILAELNKAFRIDFFVFENVLGLKHRQHEELFRYFKRLFRAAGFKIVEGQLDAKDFGVPQERKRVFIIGFNEDRYPNLKFAFPLGELKAWRTVRDAIHGLPEPVFFDRSLTPNKIPYHPNHWCMRPRSGKFSNGFLKEGDMKGRPFRVLEWNRPSWTVAYGHREVHVHPSGRRRLSVYEAMLLQGFPPEYQLVGTLSDQIRLVSDAVPPALGSALGKEIRSTLETSSRQMRKILRGKRN